MRCEFNDGLRVDFSGSLRMTKGDEVNVYLGADDIPSSVRSDLEMAANHKSCSQLREAVREVTDVVGSNLPEE